MIGTAELILFGMQAAIKLAKAGRDIYKEEAQGRSIEFPLPTAFNDPPSLAEQHAERIERILPERFEKEFRQAYEDARKGADEEIRKNGKKRLLELYLYDLGAGNVETSRPDYQEIAGKLAIKQWAKGDAPTPHPLQRAAGTLAEIAIDYFLHVPGALREDSKYGRTVKAFLTGLDDFNFQESRWDQIAITLFTTAVDTVADDPDLLSEDEEDEKLIKEIVAGVAAEMKEQVEKLNAKVPEGDPDAEKRIVHFGQMTLRSLLKNAGIVALESPSLIRVKTPGDRALINAVGSTLLKLLLEDTDEAGDYSVSKALDRMASKEGIDNLIMATLQAVGEHPEVFRVEEEVFEQWIKHVVTELYQGHEGGGSFFHSNLFAEVAYLVVDHGLRDLPSLLRVGDDQRVMLVTVARQVFEAISDPPRDGKPVKWKSDLSESDVRTLFASVLGSFSSNPHWLFKREEMQRAAAPLIGLAVDVLANLGSDTFKILIRSGRLESVVSAVLASGLIEGMDKALASRTGAAFQMVMEGVSERGVTRLAQILEDDRLKDLLTAIAKSEDVVLKKLFGEEAEDAAKVAGALAEILDSLRNGTVLSVPEMTESLERSVT